MEPVGLNLFGYWRAPATPKMRQCAARRTGGVKFSRHTLWQLLYSDFFLAAFVLLLRATKHSLSKLELMACHYWARLFASTSLTCMHARFCLNDTGGNVGDARPWIRSPAAALIAWAK
jgi:hypothetical protein